MQFFVFYTFSRLDCYGQVLMFNKLALNQNGTHNRPDLVYFAFPEDCAQQIKRSGLATEGKLAKKLIICLSFGFVSCILW